MPHTDDSLVQYLPGGYRMKIFYSNQTRVCWFCMDITIGDKSMQYKIRWFFVNGALLCL